MAKSKAATERKMRDRIAGAGPYMKEGMEEAPDPIEILLGNVSKYEKKLVDGLLEAIRGGKYKVGLERAKGRNAYKGSVERAARHFEERADDIVKHSMEDYDQRMSCVDKVKAALVDLPRTTRTQKIAAGGKYQEEVGKCFDSLYGRK